MIEKRNVPAADRTTGVKPWDLTSSQWLVYYWLLSKSNWNSFTKENHYYIYKNKIVNAQIMRECGIKTQNTIRSAFKKLLEVGAIGESSYADAYEIYYPEIYVPLDMRIVKFFISFNKYLDAACMIALYSILRRIFIFDKGEPLDFTISLLATVLGKAKQSADRTEILLMLSVFEFSGLANIVKVPYTNKFGVPCVRYTLTQITESGEGLKDFFNEDDDIDTLEKKAAEFLTKLKIKQ